LIPKSYHTSGTQRLKRAVKVLGSRTIDQRTSMGKALAAYRDDLIADLGGAENLSRQEHLLVEEVIITTLLLSSVNAWLLAQKSLVSKKARGVIAAVRDRNSLVLTLKGLLESLGLKRRAKQADSLESIAAEYAERRRSESGPATEPEEQGEGDGAQSSGEAQERR
jgi:hypothetical protein